MWPTTRSLFSALGLLFYASSAHAIEWNDIAIGTDTGINGGSVFTVKSDDLNDSASVLAPPLDLAQNPAINQGVIADVGFQTNLTPIPPNAPPNTIAGQDNGAPLETVVWVTSGDQATSANANRPRDKVLANATLPTGFAGSDLTVLGDDSVFFGGSGAGDGVILSSGLNEITNTTIDVLGSPAVGDGVVDSVWQKLPADNVAIAYIDGGLGKLGIRDTDGSIVGADITLGSLPVDVDVYRQDPTLVIAEQSGLISVLDGTTLLASNEIDVTSGPEQIVAISVLSDDSVAVALYDGTNSLVELYDADLNFVADSGSLYDGIEITAMDNQNRIDTLVVGDATGVVSILDTPGLNVLQSRDFGDGAITAITVNAPEPAAVALGLLAIAGCGTVRRRDG